MSLEALRLIALIQTLSAFGGTQSAPTGVNGSCLLDHSTLDTPEVSDDLHAPAIELFAKRLGIGAIEPGWNCVEIGPEPDALGWAKEAFRSRRVKFWLTGEWTRQVYSGCVRSTGVHLKAVLPVRPGCNIRIDGETAGGRRRAPHRHASGACRAAWKRVSI